MHYKDHAQYDLCDSGVYTKEITNMFLVGQVSGLVENFHIVIYLDTITVINAKLCMVVLLIGLYLFILKMLRSYPI